MNPGVAVYCFFILSGFYITMGLNERYTGPGSTKAFYFGRFLRLWPTYLLSLVIIAPTGMIAYTFWRAAELPIPAFLGILFSNVFIIGQDIFAHLSFEGNQVRFSQFGVDPNHNGTSYMLNLPAWSLAIECVFYAAAPFIVRSFARTVTFLMVGLVYTSVWLNFFPAIITQYRVDLYYPFPALLFGLGSMGYWLYRRADMSKTAQYLLFAIITCVLLQTNVNKAGVIYLLLAFGVGFLFEKTQNSKIDRVLGDLSYPVYILQIPVFSLLRTSGFTPSPTAAILTVFGVSILAVYLVERPIERLRKAYVDKALARQAGQRIPSTSAIDVAS